MSKQPSTTNALLSRLRHPARRLRDLPIWSKLGLIMMVPTLATIIVGVNGLVGHIRDANDADRARTLAQLTEAAGTLAHGLQNERAAAVVLLGTADANAKQNRLTTFRETHGAVDSAQRPYTQNSTAVSDVPANFTELMRGISQNLGDLSGIRGQVESDKVTLTDAKNFYQTLIGRLLNIGQFSAQLAGDLQLAYRMGSAAAIASQKEFLSQERVVVLTAFTQGELTPKLRRDFIATQTNQDQTQVQFEAAATAGERQQYENTVAGSALREAISYQGAVNDLQGTSMAGLTFDANDWDTAMVGRAELLRDVEVALDRNMVGEATRLRDDVTRTVLIETGVLLGMLLLAILFAWLVARSMARSLRELRHGALSVAQYGLPQAVARLRDPALSAQSSPQQVAAQIAEPLPVRTKDEFGQVTEAFNAVHLEAVRTAAEQAALRASVATMFVNLARRSQILVDRLIGHLDRLERGEEDPDALAELFQLDHLATRMRRNDENLLVLAGADSTRVQREPAALIDVLRAAQSEVEHYTRIEFGVIDRDIEVAAHAVNDLVHLLAELFDNATAFSPPDSHVVVEARRVGDRATLYVEDRGIGISPEQLAELNERLATPPMVDVAVSRMMGLVVVARLAARHGVKVELRRAAERGTVADVMLPTSVLVPRALVGRTQTASRDAVSTSAPTSAAPAQRSFGSPLALEPGPSARGGPPAFSGGFAEPAPAGPGGLLGPAAAARAMPAWSDLTGATGANGGGGPGRNGSNGPNGAGYGPSPFQAAPPPPPPEPFIPRTPEGPRSQPLPQRRATDPWTVDGEVADDGPPPAIPRQVPVNPEARLVRPMPPPPTSEVPQGLTPPVPPVSAPPSSAPPASVGTPPPAWPPLVAGAPPAEGDDAGASPPPVPEELAAALDMTAELPNVRPSTPAPAEEPSAAQEPSAAEEPAEAPASAPPTPRTPRVAASAAAANRARMPDETMELPIFRELESAWFRTRRPATPPQPAAAPSSAPPAPAAAPASAPPVTVPNGARQSVMNGATAVPAGGTGAAWQTAADDGWRAASAASEVPVTETTEAGLPKRVPMAQLVPGGVEKPAAAVQRRTPEAVRGLLSAYHRGVQRGRTEPKDEPANPEPTTAGPQQQGGKEQEA